MKAKQFFLALTIIISNASWSQTPYDAFAQASTKREMLKLPDTSFKIYNTDTASSIKYYELDKETFQVSSFDKNNSLMQTFALQPTDQKWLSTDPKMKAGESPYASFSNSPIYLVDKDGRDTLVVHRSELSETATNTNIYVITFSVIQNGVEKSLQTVHSYNMFTNASASAVGYNNLDKKPVYNLTFQPMSNENLGKNTINIYKGVFLHPAFGISDLGGCVGFCRQEDAVREEVVPGTNTFHVTSFQKSKDAMQDLRNIYNDVAKNYNLTGSKFILKTQSTAPSTSQGQGQGSSTPSFTPSGSAPPADSTPVPGSTMGPPEDQDY